MNINTTAKRVLVFGDSISWGYMPGTKHQRYAVDTRWPGKLQLLLGDGYEIIEENLNSRAIENGDPRPGKEGRRALDYIVPCLDSHDPLDYVVILLGTNELKNEFNMSAEQVGAAMEKLLNVIIDRSSQCSNKKPNLILLSPPIVKESTDYCRADDKYSGAAEKSKALAGVYENLAKKLDIDYINLESINSGIDGVHIDSGEHAKLAQLVYEHLTA